MRMLWGTCCAGMMMIAALAVSARADAVEDCAQVRNLDRRVRGCTSVIASEAATAEQKAIAHRNRGLARADAGARDQAMADFNEAIRLNSNDAAAYAGRAHARLAKSETDAAIADFSRALALTPLSSPLLIGRGYAYIVKGQADLAIADLTEAVRLNPKSASAHNHRGLAYRKKGDLKRAIDDYTAAIQINPIYALAYNNRGYAHEAMGKRAEAIDDFNIALLLDSTLVGAADGLTRLKRDGDLKVFVKESRRLVEEGKVLVEANCAACHAVGPKGQSANPLAPPFRTLQQRHPARALREPLTRGIAAPHDVMPKFTLPDRDVDKIIAYINSLPLPSGS